MVWIAWSHKGHEKLTFGSPMSEWNKKEVYEVGKTRSEAYHNFLKRYGISPFDVYKERKPIHVSASKRAREHRRRKARRR